MKKPRLKTTLVYTAFGLLLLYVFTPYIWLFTASFSEGANLSVQRPDPFTLASFGAAFSGLTLRWVLNSVVISVSSVLVCLLVTLPGGYALARARFRGKKATMYGIILTQIVPAPLIVVPIYSIFLILGFLNTHSGLILLYAGLATAVNLWVMRGAADAIPVELEEAAQLDGASRSRILLTIVLPLMGPGVAAASVLAFMPAWGGFLMPLILLTDSTKYPISVGLFTALGLYGEIDYSLLAAMALIYMAPVMILYFAIGNRFQHGLGAIGTGHR